MSNHDVMAVSVIVEKMRLNSALWHTASVSERDVLYRANRALGEALHAGYGIPVVYDQESGVWYLDQVGGRRLYDTY